MFSKIPRRAHSIAAQRWEMSQLKLSAVILFTVYFTILLKEEITVLDEARNAFIV
jgi:hypothetical protein